jgi:hypothetical protein
MAHTRIHRRTDGSGDSYHSLRPSDDKPSNNVQGAERGRERKRREMGVGAEANFIRNFSFILSFLLFCWSEPGSQCEAWLQGCLMHGVRKHAVISITLQWNPHLCIPRKEIALPQSQFLPHTCAIHIFPGSVHIFSCSRIGRPIVGIYKSLTDTGM